MAVCEGDSNSADVCIGFTEHGSSILCYGGDDRRAFQCLKLTCEKGEKRKRIIVFLCVIHAYGAQIRVRDLL